MKTKRYSNKTKYVGTPCGDGSFTTFYKLKGRKTIGFKDFGSKEEAVESMENQRLLAEYNMAPRVYGKVRKIDYIDSWYKKRRSGWGFITEIATTVDDEEGEEKYFDEDEFRDEVYNLIYKMNMELGIHFGDSHSRNVGWVKRGKEEVLVCIDTGKESFSGEYCYP
jgi:hypothetical protein